MVSFRNSGIEILYDQRKLNKVISTVLEIQVCCVNLWVITGAPSVRGWRITVQKRWLRFREHKYCKHYFLTLKNLFFHLITYLPGISCTIGIKYATNSHNTAWFSGNSKEMIIRKFELETYMFNAYTYSQFTHATGYHWGILLGD